MTRRNFGKPARVSEEFDRMIKEAARERIRNRIDLKIRGSKEMTKMILNCPSFIKVEKELTTIPKKEDLQ